MNIPSQTALNYHILNLHNNTHPITKNISRHPINQSHPHIILIIRRSTPRNLASSATESSHVSQQYSLSFSRYSVFLFVCLFLTIPQTSKPVTHYWTLEVTLSSCFFRTLGSIKRKLGQMIMHLTTNTSNLLKLYCGDWKQISSPFSRLCLPFLIVSVRFFKRVKDSKPIILGFWLW